MRLEQSDVRRANWCELLQLLQLVFRQNLAHFGKVVCRRDVSARWVVGFVVVVADAMYELVQTLHHTARHRQVEWTHDDARRRVLAETDRWRVKFKHRSRCIICNMNPTSTVRFKSYILQIFLDSIKPSESVADVIVYK